MALQTLFRSELGEHLVFKGGTSLSKAYGAIKRFSEDVDLTYDIRAIAPDLVGERSEALPTTRSEEKRWSKAVRDRLPKWVDETTQPLIQDAIEAQGLPASTRADGDTLFIGYEAASSGPGYVAPKRNAGIRREIDRRTGEPA
nr:nucleotidyl transferase AbiEii/AbiGii toxin family protein [Celeribacter ethanolicus]